MAQPWELDWSKAGGKPQDESAPPWERSWGAPVAEKKPDDTGNASRGFKEAFQQLPQLGYGLLAGTGAALESAVGEGGIATGIKKAGVRGFQEWGDKIASQSKDTDSWNYAWDAAKQGDIGALGAWLAHGLGYAGGQAVQMLATAGIGAVAGKATLGAVASSLAEGMVKKEAAALAATGAAKGLTAEQLTAAATKNVASRIGQTAAIGASAFGMEGGEIFGDLTQEATKEGRVLSGGELAKAFGATLAAGGLEFVGDKVGLDILLGKSRLLKPAEGMAGIGGRAARGGIAVAGAAPIEGATEYGQTLLEEFGKGKDPFSEESRAQAVDAAALGALGGAAMGGVGGAIRGPQKKPSATDVLAADSVEDAAKAALLAISGPTVKADWEVVDGVRALPGPSIPEPAGMLRSLSGPDGSVYMVDSQGNAAVQPAAVRADAISRATEAAVQADAAAAERAALGKQTPRGAAPAVPGMAPIPVGEATEVPAIPTGDATELEPIPVGEVSELLPTGDASELPRRIPIGRATELPVETIRADDLLTGDGVPYGSKTAANVRAKKEGLNPGSVVEIPGAGWVVRPAATDGAVDGADTARVAGQRAVDGTRGDGTQRLPDQRPGDVPAGAGMAAPQDRAGVGPAGLGAEQPTALKPGDSVTVSGKTWTVSAVQPDRLVISSSDGVKRMVAAGSRTWNEIQAANTAPATAPTPAAEQQQEGQTYEVTTRQGTTVDAGAEVAPVIKPAGELPKRTEARGTARHPATVMGSRLLATVSQGLGGLDPAWLGEFSTRRETRRIGRDGRPIVQWANPLIPGVGKLFRRGGTQDLQLLAEALERAGYLEPGSVEANAKDAGERAKAMIRQALEKAEPQTMAERQAEAEAELLARQQQYDAAEDANDYSWLDPESAAEAQAEREAIMAEAGLSVAEMAAVQDDDIDLFSDKPAMPQDEAMRALGFTEQEIADELARQKASADRAAGRGAEEARQDGPGQARAPAEAGSTEARQGTEGAREGLTLQAQTAEDLKAKTDREEAAQRAEKSARDAEQARLKKADEDRDNRARADQTVDDFQLGQSAEQQMSGMGDLFAEPAPAAQEPINPDISRSAFDLGGAVAKGWSSAVTRRAGRWGIADQDDTVVAGRSRVTLVKGNDLVFFWFDAKDETGRARATEAAEEWAKANPTLDAATAQPARAKRDDGRTIPEEGDKVYTQAGGFGGMPAVVRGEVKRGAGGLFVAIEGAQGMLGEQARGKRTALSADWTLVGEEHPNARKARESAQRIADDAATRKADREAMLTAAAERNGTLDPATVEVGDVLELADGTRGTVTDKEPYGIFVDGRSIGNDMRGIKKVAGDTPASKYKPGDRITPDVDVLEGDIVRHDGKLWMAKVKRGVTIPLAPMVDGKPQVSADTVVRVDLRENEVRHTGANVYGYGGQPKEPPATNQQGNPGPTNKVGSASAEPAGEDRPTTAATYNSDAAQVLASIDRNALAGRTIVLKAVVEDSGQTATLKLDAADYTADLKRRAELVRNLIECLKG